MKAALSPVRDYWKSSRAPRYSLLFVLPLVIAYEILALTLSYEAGGVRNGADVFLRWAFYSLLGANGPLILGSLLTLACAVLFFRDLRASGSGLRISMLLFMALESAVLAALLGTVVATVTANLLAPLPLAIVAQRTLTGAELLMVSLGAGVYEELLFRVIVVSGLSLLFLNVFRWSKTSASIAAVLLGALIFSAFHYVGPFADKLELQSFMFRFIAGLFFSGLYVLRGFGITAWTHALYDVYLLV